MPLFAEQQGMLQCVVFPNYCTRCADLDANFLMMMTFLMMMAFLMMMTFLMMKKIRKGRHRITFVLTEMLKDISAQLQLSMAEQQSACTHQHNTTSALQTSLACIVLLQCRAASRRATAANAPSHVVSLSAAPCCAPSLQGLNPDLTSLL